jgi:hypothetical protein
LVRRGQALLGPKYEQNQKQPKKGRAKMSEELHEGKKDDLIFKGAREILRI